MPISEKCCTTIVHVLKTQQINKLNCYMLKQYKAVTGDSLFIYSLCNGTRG